MFKVNKKKTPHRRHWHRSGVFIVNFEHIPYPPPVFLLLIVDYYSYSLTIGSSTVTICGLFLY